MSVETATYISQLNPSYPAAGDPKSEGDDHMRLTKQVLQNQFPNLGAVAVTVTAAQLNALPASKSEKAGDTYTGTHNFSGATSVAVPTPTTPTAAVTKAYADALAFSAVLPAQAGNAGKFVTTDGTNAAWGTVSTITALKEIKTSPTCAATTVLDLSTGNAFAFTLSTAITTLTLSNAPAAGNLFVFILDLTMNGTGYAITWPASVKWAGGTAPTLTSTNGKRDVFSFQTWDGGTTYVASIVGQNL